MANLDIIGGSLNFNERKDYYSCHILGTNIQLYLTDAEIIQYSILITNLEIKKNSHYIKNFEIKFFILIIFLLLSFFSLALLTIMLFKILSINKK